MTAPDLDDFEELLLKLIHATACCTLLANSDGRPVEGEALYFLEDGLERIKDEVRGWVDATIEANKAAEANGPRAVS